MSNRLPSSLDLWQASILTQLTPDFFFSLFGTKEWLIEVLLMQPHAIHSLNKHNLKGVFLSMMAFGTGHYQMPDTVYHFS